MVELIGKAIGPSSVSESAFTNYYISSETAGQIETKLHVEPPWGEGTKRLFIISV